MAFAQVSTETDSAQDTDSTVHTVSLPASLANGNLGIIAVIIDGVAGTITPPTGWTDLIAGFTNNAGGNNVHGAAWYKRLDGTEGATVTFTTGNGQRSAHKAWQISADNTAVAPQGAGVGDGGTASLSADPPITPTLTGAPKDFLILAIGGKDRGALTFNAFPASYTNTGEHNQSANDSGGVCIAWGRREVTGSSENPGAFTFPTTNRNTVAMTIAVHPTTVSTQTVSPSGKATNAVYGSHTLANVAAKTAAPAGKSSAAVYGTHALASSSVKTITHTGLASSVAYGSHTLAKVASRAIAPSGIASAAVFGTHEVAVSAGVPTAARFGTHQVAETGFTLTVPTGLVSATRYGTQSVFNTPEVATPSGIATAVLYGSHTLAREASGALSPAGIDSAGAFGTLTIADITLATQPPGLDSAARLGRHTLIGGVPQDHRARIGILRRRLR